MAERDKVTVGWWPDPDSATPETGGWYIAWLPEERYSSASREPTEAEVRAAVKAINTHDRALDLLRQFVEMDEHDNESMLERCTHSEPVKLADRHMRDIVEEAETFLAVDLGSESVPGPAVSPGRPGDAAPSVL